MSPDIIGFVTRADAGLVKPRSISRSITPEHGGVAVHWGGGGNPPSTHDGCLALWKRWQTFHMSDGWAGLPNGGSDIAYTGGYCNHGYAFAGRGIGVRSGAQGTKVGNDHYYSFVWLGGSGGRPNSLAYSALGWWIVQARAAGAGTGVRPHSWFKSTGCPGPDLRDFASDHHNKPLLEDDPMFLPITPNSHREEIRHVQEMLGVPATGDWEDFRGALEGLRRRSGTGDNRDHINGRMYVQLLEEFIDRPGIIARMETWVRDHVKTSIAAAIATGAGSTQIDYGQLVQEIGRVLAGG